MVPYAAHCRSPRALLCSAGAVLAAGFAAAAAAAEPKDHAPELRSPVVLVLENRTGKALISRRAGERRAIASLTKMQAALVYRGRGLKLDAGTVITREDHKVALGGCRTRLELNWTYRNRDLLHAALMASDNRAISALGRAVGLHPTALVQAMNERARKMGLKQTAFTGPAGIDHGNVSTAWELSRIVRAVSRDQVLREIMGKREHRVVPLRGYLKVFYRNTNPLVGGSASTVFTASKTGYNADAGYCIAAVAQLRGLGEYTFVLLGGKHKSDRVRDLRTVIRWLRATNGRGAESS